MTKYETLLNTIDQIRKEAPIEYKSYYPLDNNSEGLNRARSKSLIHLFLKVNYGILDFLEREKQITEGSFDGGVDAFYIDKEVNKIVYIQSKFRTNEKNFINKEIEFSELLKMDVDRIVKGEDCDENGNRYNDKIQNMVKKIKEIPDLPKYNH